MPGQFSQVAMVYLSHIKILIYVRLSSIYLSGLEPPPLPPQVTLAVEGQTQTYQGEDPSNTVTLAEGYTGDVTCRVEGGYPDPHNTQLKCGNLDGSVGGKTSTLSFTAAPLTRDMDGTVCTCTSQHDSGCYSNRETRLTLNVVCK